MITDTPGLSNDQCPCCTNREISQRIEIEKYLKIDLIFKLNKAFLRTLFWWITTSCSLSSYSFLDLFCSVNPVCLSLVYLASFLISLLLFSMNYSLFKKKILVLYLNRSAPNNKIFISCITYMNTYIYYISEVCSL